MAVKVQNIQEMVMAGVGQPKKLTLNLALAFTDREFTISGTQFGVWNAPLSTDQILVRFNESRAQQIPFNRTMILAAPFTKVYITVPAGMTGDMVLLYGHGSMDLFRIFPSVPEPFTSMEAILTAIRDELQGPVTHINFNSIAVGLAATTVRSAEPNRRGLVVQARWDNAGIIYVGFNNGVGPTTYAISLAAGEAYTWDNYRGAIWAEASVAAQEIGYGEW